MYQMDLKKVMKERLPFAEKEREFSDDEPEKKEVKKDKKEKK